MLSNVANEITSASYENKSLIGNLANSTDLQSSSARAPLTASEAYRSCRTEAEANTIFIPKAPVPLTFRSPLAALPVEDWPPRPLSPGILRTSTAGATSGGVFTRMQNSIATSLNQIGSNINYVNNQTTYNNDKVDALNSGLGSLVDADLAKESAQLTALQIRQQLGTQALSLANQAPQTLLSLFK